MNIICGIDEAGYGPRLGPLVVSATLFATTEAYQPGRLWELLSGSVTKEVNSDSERIAVADSKLLYRRRIGFKRLEETALSFLALTGVAFPQSMRTLLARLVPALVETSPYQWYEPENVTVPYQADCTAIESYHNLLARDTDRCGVEFLGAFSLPVLTGEFNQRVSLGQNKAQLLWRKVAALINLVTGDHNHNRIFIIADKLGGRRYYSHLLQDLFDHSAVVQSIERGRKVSIYQVSDEAREINIMFAAGGERVALPVALASIFSKYIRELFILQLNHFFKTHIEWIRPTAGYPQDAERFLRETEELRERLQLDNEFLIRTR